MSTRTNFYKVSEEYPLAPSSSSFNTTSTSTKHVVRSVLILSIIFFICASAYSYNMMAKYLKFPDTNVEIPYQLTMAQAALFAIIIFIFLILFK